MTHLNFGYPGYPGYLGAPWIPPVGGMSSSTSFCRAPQNNLTRDPIWGHKSGYFGEHDRMTHLNFGYSGYPGYLEHLCAPWIPPVGGVSSSASFCRVPQNNLTRDSIWGHKSGYLGEHDRMTHLNFGYSGCPGYLEHLCAPWIPPVGGVSLSLIHI